MRCKILHESKNRMRVHLFRKYMSCDEADKVEYFLLGLPYVNEVNSNPFNDKLFAYHQTRQGWMFHPEFIETLLSKASEVPEENPLVGKYLEWGAKSVAEIPSALLKVKDGMISKELVERNLAVRNEDYEGLFRRLNENANAYLDEQMWLM